MHPVWTQEQTHSIIFSYIYSSIFDLSTIWLNLPILEQVLQSRDRSRWTHRNYQQQNLQKYLEVTGYFLVISWHSKKIGQIDQFQVLTMFLTGWILPKSSRNPPYVGKPSFPIKTVPHLSVYKKKTSHFKQLIYTCINWLCSLHIKLCFHECVDFIKSGKSILELLDTWCELSIW